MSVPEVWMDVVPSHGGAPEHLPEMQDGDVGQGASQVKIDHSVADHRLAIVRSVQLYVENDKGERIVMAIQEFGNNIVMPPHQKWGIEAVYEAVEERESATEAARKG